VHFCAFKQQIICAVCQMTTLDQNGAAGLADDFACRLLHIFTIGDVMAADSGCLMQIRRYQSAQREQLLLQNLCRIVMQQRGTA